MRDHRAAPRARPRQLSGGELARAGLAVALANDPPVILADEPTGELDEATAARVLDLLRSGPPQGAAVLVVTHDAQVAAARRPRDPAAGREAARERCPARPLRRRRPHVRLRRNAATVAVQPVDCEVAPARASRSSGRPGPASRRSCTCSPGSSARPSAASRGRRSAPSSCARGRSPSSSRARACCRR